MQRGPDDAPERPAARWPPPTYWARATVAVLTTLAVVWGAWRASHVVMLLLVSLVLGIGLQRPIAWLERRGLPRAAAVALLGVGVIGLIGGFLALVLPSVVREVAALPERAPDELERFRSRGWVRTLDERLDLTSKLESLGSDLPDRAWSLTTGLLGLIVDAVTIFVLTTWLAIDLPRLRAVVSGMLLPAHRERFDLIADRVTERMGGYVNGNLLVSVVAGGTTFVALWLLGVPYAAALAAWVAITDLIPTIGALLGAAAVMTVAGVSGGWGSLVASGVFFLLYQQVENYVIVPRVMKGAIDMSIGAVLVSVLVGGELAGFVGVVVALPLAAVLQTVLDELVFRDRRRAVRLQELREERLRRWATRLGRRAPPGHAA